MIRRAAGFAKRALSSLRVPTASTMPASEAELRAMSRDDLVAYALRLQHKPASQPRAAAAATAVDPAPSPPRKKRKGKGKRDFDMTRYGNRLIALKFAYLGWPFHGFASQPHSTETVEAHLFAALTKTHLIADRNSCDYSRAGRTDVGVSALSQVVGVRVRSNIVPPSTGDAEIPYAHVINACLPSSIRVTGWAPVADGKGGPVALAKDAEEVKACAEAMRKAGAVAAEGSVRRPGEAFSARFDATHRAYKYHFVRGGLDVRAMREGGKFFEGKHNFRNFCKKDENVTNFERVMYEVDVRRARAASAGKGEGVDKDPDGENEVYYIYVKGQAFLWHQVRCMVAILFEVGRGRERPDVVRRMVGDVESGEGAFASGKPQYRMAAAAPLVLCECAYPPSVVSFPVAATLESDGGGGEARWRQPAGFVRADGEMAREYAQARLQAAVAGEVLAANDAAVVGAGGGEKTFGEVRAPRNYLLDVPYSSKHVPLDQRSKEPHDKEPKEEQLNG